MRHKRASPLVVLLSSFGLFACQADVMQPVVEEDDTELDGRYALDKFRFQQISNNPDGTADTTFVSEKDFGEGDYIHIDFFDRDNFVCNGFAKTRDGFLVYGFWGEEEGKRKAFPLLGCLGEYILYDGLLTMATLQDQWKAWCETHNWPTKFKWKLGEGRNLLSVGEEGDVLYMTFRKQQNVSLNVSLSSVMASRQNRELPTAEEILRARGNEDSFSYFVPSLITDKILRARENEDSFSYFIPMEK